MTTNQLIAVLFPAFTGVATILTGLLAVRIFATPGRTASSAVKGSEQIVDPKSHPDAASDGET